MKDFYSLREAINEFGKGLLEEIASVADPSRVLRVEVTSDFHGWEWVEVETTEGETIPVCQRRDEDSPWQKIERR